MAGEAAVKLTKKIGMIRLITSYLVSSSKGEVLMLRSEVLSSIC